MNNLPTVFSQTHLNFAIQNPVEVSGRLGYHIGLCSLLVYTCAPAECQSCLPRAFAADSHSPTSPTGWDLALTCRHMWGFRSGLRLPEKWVATAQPKGRAVVPLLVPVRWPENPHMEVSRRDPLRKPSFYIHYLFHPLGVYLEAG